MLPSLVHSFVGQSSIREQLCPPAYHELTADLLLPFCQNRIHTHRGPLLGNILQQIAIDRSKEMDGETHSAASQCRIWICAWVNLHQYWPIVPENLEACCNSRGNTFVQVRLSSGHKHAQTGRGREGGREQGQPATTKQRHNKQAEQITEKGGGRGKKHTRPWHAEEQTAQSRTGNKAKTQQREGGKRRKKEKERKRTGRTREGDVPSYAFRIHGPTGEKREGVPSYTQVSRVTPREGGGWCFNYAKLPLTTVKRSQCLNFYWTFAHASSLCRAASPYGYFAVWLLVYCSTRGGMSLSWKTASALLRG